MSRVEELNANALQRALTRTLLTHRGLSEETWERITALHAAQAADPECSRNTTSLMGLIELERIRQSGLKTVVECMAVAKGMSDGNSNSEQLDQSSYLGLLADLRAATPSTDQEGQGYQGGPIVGTTMEAVGGSTGALATGAAQGEVDELADLRLPG